MGPRAGQYLARRLRSINVNRDLVCSREELDLLFTALDADKDGTLAAGKEVVIPPGKGHVAPDFELVRADDESKKVKLSSFRGEKPVALIFGSYT